MTRSGTKISTYLSSEARISMFSPQIILRLSILHRSEIRPSPCYCSDEGVFGQALVRPIGEFEGEPAFERLVSRVDGRQVLVDLSPPVSFYDTCGMHAVSRAGLNPETLIRHYGAATPSARLPSSWRSGRGASAKPCGSDRLGSGGSGQSTIMGGFARTPPAMGWLLHNAALICLSRPWYAVLSLAESRAQFSLEHTRPHRFLGCAQYVAAGS